MAPRLNKRQLREQEELDQLAAAHPPAEEDEDDDDEVDAPQPKESTASVFAALNAGQEDDDEDDESDEQEVVAKAKKSKNKKKKKKAKAGPVDQLASEAATPTSGPGTPSKKSGSKAAPDSAKKDAYSEMDDIDLALAEIASKTGGAAVEEATAARAVTAKALDLKWTKVKEVFSFDPKFLDADAELRRMFGSKVINTTPTAPRSGHHARFANNPHHSTSIRRTPSFLAQPEAGWPPAAGVLTLSRYTGPESFSDSGEWWTYQHSQRYREAQLGFLEVLQQADGNRLYNVLEAMPYHVDTLMQLSEMQVQQGDLGASSSHLSQALYALSAPLPPTFPTGTFRLPYCKIENRAFFTGIARKVSILVKRGTWRTACEWSKIALGAGGDQDPVGMLVYIDFLAPKAKQNTWFLNLLEALPVAYPEMRLENYPGLAYAKALCLRGIEEDESEDDTKSTAALKSAIIRFPMVIPLLFATLGGNVPPKLLSHRRAQVDGSFSDQPTYLLSLLAQFYSVRSSPLWKEPPVLAWLQKTVLAAAPSLDDSTLEDVRFGERIFTQGPWPPGFAPTGVIRAAYIAEIPSIRPYLPPAALSGTSYSYDPLPPSRSQPGATFYDDTYLAPLYSTGGSRARRRGAGGPRAAPAWEGPPGTVEALRNQIAELLGLGGGAGGGGVELNPELREALMQELQDLARADGGIPGGFPGGVGADGLGEEEDGEEEEGDEGDEEARRGMLGRFVQFMRGAPGGGEAPP